jgi:hypothetical protein
MHMHVEKFTHTHIRLAVLEYQRVIRTSIHTHTYIYTYILQYLGIIEQRTNEILQMYAAVQMHLKGQDVTSREAQV